MLIDFKRIIEHVEELRKLTLVAFFYTSLSFTISSFGMNFKQFDSKELSIRTSFVASDPELNISLCFLL